MTLWSFRLTPLQSYFTGRIIMVPLFLLASLEVTASLQKTPCQNVMHLTKRACNMKPFPKDQLYFLCSKNISIAEESVIVLCTPGGQSNFIYTGAGGGCGHTVGKLTHSQSKAGPLISKNIPIPRLCTVKHEPKLAKLQKVLFNLKENHPLPSRIIEMVTSPEVLYTR